MHISIYLIFTVTTYLKFSIEKNIFYSYIFPLVTVIYQALKLTFTFAVAFDRLLIIIINIKNVWSSFALGPNWK